MCKVAFTNDQASGLSNRLPLLADDYTCYDIPFDFTNVSSVEEMKLVLQYMSDAGFHLVGTRGYVYDSGQMSKMVEVLTNIYHEDGFMSDHVALLTRTANLRSAFIDLVEEGNFTND